VYFSRDSQKSNHAHRIARGGDHEFPCRSALRLSLSLSLCAGEREGTFARRAISLAARRSAFREFARTNKLAALCVEQNGEFPSECPSAHSRPRSPRAGGEIRGRRFSTLAASSLLRGVLLRLLSREEEREREGEKRLAVSLFLAGHTP